MDNNKPSKWLLVVSSFSHFFLFLFCLFLPPFLVFFFSFVSRRWGGNPLLFPIAPILICVFGRDLDFFLFFFFFFFLCFFPKKVGSIKIEYGWCVSVSPAVLLPCFFRVSHFFFFF